MAKVIDARAEFNQRRLYCGAAQLEMCGSQIGWDDFRAAQKREGKLRSIDERAQAESRRRLLARTKWFTWGALLGLAVGALVWGCRSW